MKTVFESSLRPANNWIVFFAIILFSIVGYRMIKGNSPLKSPILLVSPFLSFIIAIVWISILIYYQSKNFSFGGIKTASSSILLFAGIYWLNGILNDLVENHKIKWFTIGIVLLWLGIGIMMLYCFHEDSLDYVKSYEKYISGDADIVEGYISNFHEMSGLYPNKTEESFLVEDKEFYYNNDQSTITYCKHKNSGGVIQGDGQYVKIWYVNELIYRIDTQ